MFSQEAAQFVEREYNRFEVALFLRTIKLNLPAKPVEQTYEDWYLQEEARKLSEMQTAKRATVLV